MYKKSLTLPSIVTVVWVGIKWVLLKTESTSIITVSNPTNSESSTIKLTLMVSNLISGTSSRYSSFKDKHWIDLVYKQRLQHIWTSGATSSFAILVLEFYNILHAIQPLNHDRGK